MKKYGTEAIFFDFDGVLIDSAHIKTEAFRQLFQQYGESVVSKVVAHHQKHCGISRVEKIRYIHRAILNRPLTEQEVAVWAQRYAKLVVNKVIACRWVAGAKTFVEKLCSTHLLFVISATPEVELLEIVKKKRMDGYFDAVHGSPVRKSEHIRNLIAKYRLEPSRCLFVGDAMTDCLAAKETDVPFIGIESETAFPEETVVLRDCTRLAEWVDIQKP